jgi:hypothetical protein
VEEEAQEPLLQQRLSLRAAAVVAEATGPEEYLLLLTAVLLKLS